MWISNHYYICDENIGMSFFSSQFFFVFLRMTILKDTKKKEREEALIIFA
jgi:hypothetical protein